MKIAICITTRNRPDVFDETYMRISDLMPYGNGIESRRFIIDDASDEPMVQSGFRGHRFENNVGVAVAKNKGLELAYNWGADYIFNFDDDCYVIADDWWRSYIESGENHLMYVFGKEPMYQDEKIVTYDKTKGCMLFVTRKVLDVVGGLDTRFGIGGYEHPSWSWRIFNAGLTTYRVMDVPNSSELIYSLDQDNAVKSSIPDIIRRKNLMTNRRLYQESKTSKAYVEFRS